MAESTTLTVRLDPKLKKQLGKLAKSTRRSKSFLANAALLSYVTRELEFIRKIEEGREDIRAGRLIPHEQVMREVDEIIAAARKKQVN